MKKQMEYSFELRPNGCPQNTIGRSLKRGHPIQKCDRRTNHEEQRTSPEKTSRPEAEKGPQILLGLRFTSKATRHRKGCEYPMPLFLFPVREPKKVLGTYFSRTKGLCLPITQTPAGGRNIKSPPVWAQPERVTISPNRFHWQRVCRKKKFSARWSNENDFHRRRDLKHLIPLAES